jgi:hypothetical protein
MSYWLRTIAAVTIAAALLSSACASTPCSGKGDCAGSGWATEFPTIQCPQIQEVIQ